MSKLFAALENEGIIEAPGAEITVVAETPETALEPVAADSLETGMLETAEAEASAMDTSEAVENAGDSAAALEAIREEIIATRTRGGLTADQARAYRRAIESEMRFTGMTAHVKGSIMPAMESFDASASRRLDATNIVLESIGENLRKLWEGIVNMATRAWNYIVSFVKSLFDDASKLSARGKALRSLAADYAGASAPTEKFKDKGLISKLHVNKHVGAGSIAALQKLSKEAVDKYYRGYVDATAPIIEAIGMVGPAANNDSRPDGGEATKLENAFTKMMDTVRSKIGFMKDVKLGTAEGATRYVVAKDLPGGCVLALTVPDSAKTAGKLAMQIIDQGESVDGEFDHLSVEEVKAAGAAVAEVATNIQRIKDVVKRQEDGVKKTLEAAKKAAKEAKDETRSASATASAHLATQYLAAGNKTAASINSYLVKTAKAYCDYAEKSLRAHKKADKKAEKPAEAKAA